MTTNLLDTLLPAKAPTPKGARRVSPLDDPRGDDIEVPDVNNKSASIRALLGQHPDGLGYDEISKATGIARDKVSSFIAALISTGDIKPYEFPGRGRVFKYAGDPARVGPRVAEQRKPESQPAVKPAAAASPPKPATPQPAVKMETPALPGAEAASAVGAAPAPRAEPAAPPAAALPQETSTPKGRDQVGSADQKASAAAASEIPPAPTKPRLYDLSTELAIIAAANLAAAIRDCNIDGVPELERALLNFERADRAREEAKAGRG